MGGIMGFVSIALISTGFAAFVLSTNAEKQDSGNVNVGTVTEASLKITSVLDKPNFLFEPEKSDTTGRVRNDGTNFECLTIVVSGEVANTQYLREGGFTIKLDLPEKFQKAITDGYIVAPECATEAQKVDLTLDDASKPNVKDFSYSVTFKWGAKFNSMNPGLYYDTDPTGLSVSDAAMTETLHNLRKAAYGLDDPMGEPLEGDNVFTITLSAKAN